MRYKTYLFLIPSLFFLIAILLFIFPFSEKNTRQISSPQSADQIVSLSSSTGNSNNCPAKIQCCLKGTTLREGILFYCRTPRAPLVAHWGACVYSCDVDADICDNTDVGFPIGEGGKAPAGEPLPQLVLNTGKNGGNYGTPTFEGECPQIVR